LSVDHVTGDIMGIAGAATDTVGNALMVSICHVLANPEMHASLKEELRAVYPDSDAVMRTVDLEKLPLLNGVVKEGLR